MNSANEGWCMPPNSWRAHYFHDGVALCNGMRYTPKNLYDDGEFPEPYCCIECRRLREDNTPAPAHQAVMPFADGL